MAFKYALLLTSLLFAFHSVADTISFRDGERYKGHGYVEFERLSISDAEALKSGSGVWIALKLEFTGLRINGKEYGADGRAQISLDSHYTTASPRWDIGLKGGYCANNSDTFQFPHYSVTSLKAIVDKFNLHVGSAAIKDFGCDLRVFVGRHQPMTAEMLLNNLELSELDFVLYVLTNSETIIADTVRTSKSMSQQAKSSWRDVQKHFWSNWIGSLNKASKFTLPFFQRVNTYDVASFASGKPSSTLCVVWELSAPPRNDILKTILANAQLYKGEINTSPGGPEFCTAVRDLEKRHGNGDGKVSATEASRILALPANRIGAVGWASTVKPDTKEIKTKLKNRNLYFGPVDSRVTVDLTSSLQKYDLLDGNGDGHLNVGEIAALMTVEVSRSSNERTAEFCGIQLDYIPSPFDQGLDDPVGIQRGLIASNLLKGEADGIPGPQTCTAFKRYVDINGIDGALDRDGLINLIARGQNSPEVRPKQATTVATSPRGELDLASEVENLGQEVQQLQKLVESKEKELSELRATLDTSTASVTSIETLETQLKLARKQTNEVEKQVSELSKDREANQRELDRRRARIAILEGELRAIEREKAALQVNYQSLSETLKKTVPKSELDAKEARIVSLLEQNDRLSTELSAEQTKVLQLKTRNESLLAERSLLTESNSTKQRQIDALGTENKTLLEQLASLESKLAGYLKEEQAKTAWIDALNTDWKKRLDDMPIQQRQFCNIASEFRHDLAEATASANQIRINMTFQERQRSLDSLLPDGVFNNWLVRVITVGQMPDGSARFIAELPCDAMIGSGTIGSGPDEKWVATIPYKDRAYRELAKVSRGDFIAIQGALLEVERFEAGQPESFYGVNKIGDNPHPEAEKLGLNGEVFIAKVQYLVSLGN